MPGTPSRATRLRRWLLVAAGILAALGAALVVAGYWRYSSPEVTRRVEAVIARQLGARCQVGAFSVVPLRGFTCRDLTIERTLSDSLSVRMRAPRLDVSYKPMLLLARLPRILRFGTELVAGRRTIAEAVGWSSGDAGSLSRKMASFSRSLVGAVLEHATVTDASIEVLARDAVALSAGGIRMHADILQEPEPVIAIEAEAQSLAALGRWNAEKVALTASISGPSLRLARITGRMCGGRVAAYGGFDVDRHRLDSLIVRASKLDMSEVYRASGAVQGAIAGRGALNLEFRPGPLVADSLRAKGEATVTNLTVSDHPIQNLILTNLLVPSVAQLTFDKATARVRIEEGAVYTTDMRAKGSPLSISANGWVSFARKLDYKIQGTLTKEFLASLPPVVRESLVPARNGAGSFSCRIYGPLDAPVVSVDKKNVDRAVNSVIQSLSKELRKYFR